MIRLLIVDDHPTMRRGLLDLFANADEVEVVGAVADGEEAMVTATSQCPDVVLMDISMPGLGGIEAARRLLRLCPHTRVVMLTSFAEHERVMDAFSAGAIGFLTKDATPEEILRGVHAAARGESPLSPRAAAVVVQAAQTRSRPAEELTPREREVLQFLVRGLANKQIAWRMGISEKTVKAHLTNVFQRIGVEDRTQAALWAREHGMS